ncbi:MAG: ribosomal subunit protein [Pseudomonadota bacterium]|jgi:large subunit ribosomal protein L24
MNKIRKGDEVIVITGKDKGKRGMVTAVQIKEGTVAKVLVQGVAVKIKHVRPNPQAGVEGGRISKEAYIDVSNVALVDANGKPSKVKIEEQDGKKVRVLKTTGAVIA